MDPSRKRFFVDTVKMRRSGKELRDVSADAQGWEGAGEV